MEIKRTFENGFTLVELLISVSIFIIIVTMAMGSLVIVFQSNRQTAAIRIALDNANFALNSMSREMRLGTNFNCIDVATCSGGEMIAFDYYDRTITYRLDGGVIMKQSDLDEAFLPVTTDRYEISSLKFTESGAFPKMITIEMTGSATAGDRTTDFDLQTSVSSRQF